jgi:hypothetical protein
LEKFARLRKLEDELTAVEEHLEQNPEYAEAQSMIQEYEEKEAKINLLIQEIPELEEKINVLTQMIEENKEKIESFLY